MRLNPPRGITLALLATLPGPSLAVRPAPRIDLDVDLGLGVDHTLIALDEGTFADGQPIDAQRADTTRITGDLRLGARTGFGLAAYTAITGAADPAGRPALRAAELDPTDAALHRQLIHPYGDAFGFIHLAWAELEGLGRGDLARALTLRAGRQFHWGARGVTFDGVKLGFTSEAITLELHGGRRAGVYALDQDDPGLVAGARMLVDFSRGDGPPLSLRAEYQLLQRTLDLDPIGAYRYDAAALPGPIDQSLGLGELALWYDVDRDLLLELRLEILDALPSHLRAGARWVIGNTLLTLDLDQKVGEDAPYDLAAGRSLTALDPRLDLDRPTTLEALRLNIPDRQPYTDLAARLTIEPLPGWAIEPHARAHIVHADPIDRTAWDADHYDLGLAASGALTLTPTTALELEASYDATLYDRDAIGPIALLDDVAAAPEGDRHAIAAGIRYAAVDTPTRGRRLLTARWLTLGLGGAWTRYGFGGRYLDAGSEALLALRTEAILRLGAVTVDGRYEYARDASVAMAWLGDVHFARLRVGAVW